MSQICRNVQIREILLTPLIKIETCTWVGSRQWCTGCIRTQYLTALDQKTNLGHARFMLALYGWEHVLCFKCLLSDR